MAIKWKTGVCNKCWAEEILWILILNKGTCNKCNNTPETKPPEVKLVEKKVLPKQVETSEEMFHWLKLYTSSYLNNKMKIHLNSIKNEIPCIKYKDKYILKEDIIQKFKQDYL